MDRPVVRADRTGGRGLHVCERLRPTETRATGTPSGAGPPKRTVTPSRRMLRVNQVMEKKMAPAVSDRVMATRSRGKAPAEAVRRSHSTTPPLTNMATAHRNETRTKNRWTVGRASSSGVSGQKSWVKRWVKGRPRSAEPTNASEARNVLAVGWMKYRKRLPVTKEMTVRIVSRMVPSKQERRHPLVSHQASGHDQVRPHQRSDQRAAKSGDQEHEVVRSQGGDDALEAPPARRATARDVARACAERSRRVLQGRLGS